jgi:hypothetical protein
MDGTRFDAWTRRRFGLAAGGMAAFVLFRDSPEAAAGKKRRKKRKKRCKRLRAGCNPGGKRTCCGKLTCSTYSPTGEVPPRCCKQPGEPCAAFDECCSQSCFQDACLDT